MSGAEIMPYAQESQQGARRGDRSLRRPDVDASASPTTMKEVTAGLCPLPSSRNPIDQHLHRHTRHNPGLGIRN